jgi:translation initiation factor 4E
LVLPELQVRMTVCLERRRLLNWVDTLEQEEDGSSQKNGQLRTTWAFWFDGPPEQSHLSAASASWGKEPELQALGSFSTIKDFWKVWGTLDVKLPEYSNFRLFKQGVKPTWDDPHNVNGGKIVIRTKKSDTSRIWFELILIVITQQISPMNAVSGIVLSIRPNENEVSVWVRSEMEADSPFIARMSETLRGQLGLKPRAKIFHQYHNRGESDGGSSGRGGWQGKKSRSLPQTPDYSSDDEAGGGGVGGVQPDILTEKLQQLAAERSGREVQETVPIEQTSSHRRLAGSGSLLPRGMLAQTKEESEEEGETESDRDSTPRKVLDAGGGDPNAFGQLDRRQVSLNSSHRCQRAVH